uniref:Proline-rich protein HaeIII subfamily 1-like n=1 Tax=Nicotiana tabacum TaxID=4097 RepID=A0A1S4AFT6_TOBAC|nr:PREDICTED: proline-rich protein HaeIII subfamily 1-like [Nicotiana tabacum]
MAVDPLFDDAGEHPRGEDNPPTTTLSDSTTPAQVTPVPTPTKGAMVPPPGIPIPPQAPAYGSGISDRDLRGSIQMLAQIVASQSSATAPPTGHSQQQKGHFRPNQGSKGPYNQGQSGGRFPQQRRPLCPRGSAGRGIADPSSPAAGTSSAAPPARGPPAPAGRGILTVQTHHVYALIDLGSTLSCVTPYVTTEFGIEQEHCGRPSL